MGQTVGTQLRGFSTEYVRAIWAHSGVESNANLTDQLSDYLKVRCSEAVEYKRQSFKLLYTLERCARHEDPTTFDTAFIVLRVLPNSI